MPNAPGAQGLLALGPQDPPIRVVKYTLYGPDLTIRVEKRTHYVPDHPIGVAFPTLSRPYHPKMA